LAELAFACPLCGGGRIEPLHRYERAQLSRCHTCGFVFSMRRPGDDELGRHYGGYSRMDFDSPLTRQRYRELLERFERYRALGRILDVGCGIGFFLEEAQRDRWDARGTEFGSRAVEINLAKGFDVVDAATDAALFEPGYFDVVTAFEVIEHVRDPRAHIASIARLVRPGGLFYCTTPNFDSLSRRVLRDRWTVIDYPEHLNYFTLSTLERLLGCFGFAALEVVSTGLSFARLQRTLTSADGPAQPGATLDESLRSQFDRSRFLTGARNAVNGVLGVTGTGDTLKGWFERRG